jgi:hypothetical protein
LRKISKTKTPLKVGSNPSDLHEIGCKNNGKTHPMVPVTLPRPETAKWTLFLKIIEIVENFKIEICSVNFKLSYTHLLYTHFPFSIVQRSVFGSSEWWAMGRTSWEKMTRSGSWTCENIVARNVDRNFRCDLLFLIAAGAI